MALLLYTAPDPPTDEYLQLFRNNIPGLSAFSMANAGIVPPMAREVVSFFSAQTLCTLCQSGFEAVCQLFSCSDSQEEVFRQIRLLLTELIFCYRAAGSSPTVRQLTQAISASSIFILALVAKASSGYDPDHTDAHSTSLLGNNESLQRAEEVADRLIRQIFELYSRSHQLFHALLEELSVLPLDVQNKKIAITSQERSMVLYLLLSQSVNVFHSIAKIFDTLSPVPRSDSRAKDYPTIQSFFSPSLSTPSNVTLRKLILQCYQNWLEAHSRYQRLAHQNDSMKTLSKQLTLLRETPTIPILLLSFEAGVQECLANYSNLTPPDYRPNSRLEIDFAADDALGWQVVTAASDAIVEGLDFFYSTSFHVAPAGE